ncbi:hypothetical protein HYU13_04485 [Candidatus Woesearchaeota archaeon]|nr:hypothetical protein [Candidatus Woesearchaeota archaeon]
MGSKNITIMEDAYELFKLEKGPEESFSDVVRRVIVKKPKEGLRSLIGLISEKEGGDMLTGLKRIKEVNKRLSKEKRHESP